MTANQFDVFANPDPGSASRTRTSSFCNRINWPQLNTRVVARSFCPQHPVFERIMPLVEVEGASYVIDPTNLGVVRESILSNAVANLEAERYRILGAIDLLSPAFEHVDLQNLSRGGMGVSRARRHLCGLAKDHEDGFIHFSTASR